MSNHRYAKHMKQEIIELKGKIDKSTIRYGDLTTKSTIDTTCGQKIKTGIKNSTPPSSKSIYL